MRSEEFVQFVQSEWQQIGTAGTLQELHDKMLRLQGVIKDWNDEKIGNIKAQIKVCRDYLGWINKVEELRHATELDKRVKAPIKKRYTQLSVQEEDIWKQRAKVRWELHGDRNTRYFHTLASASRRTEMISQIEYRGNLHSGQKTKAQAFFEFHVALMGSESPDVPHISWQQLYNCQHDLQDLSVPITQQEIRAVINTWPNNKSSGPEGFTGEFYKAFMETLIPDIHAVLSFVIENRGRLSPLNSSHNVLIPKKPDACQPQDFRPISLIHGI